MSEVKDCNYHSEGANTFFRISNDNIKELHFSKINNIVREESDFKPSNSVDSKTVYNLRLELESGTRTSQFSDIPNFYNCMTTYSDIDEEVRESSLSVIGLSSFNEAEIDEYEKHIRVLAGL